MGEHKHQERYGQWAGSPKGNKPDTDRCAKEVQSDGGFHFYQCSRKLGHGPNEMYCKQHAKLFNPIVQAGRDRNGTSK